MESRKGKRGGKAVWLYQLSQNLGVWFQSVPLGQQQTSRDLLFYMVCFLTSW